MRYSVLLSGLQWFFKSEKHIGQFGVASIISFFKVLFENFVLGSSVRRFTIWKLLKQALSLVVQSWVRMTLIFTLNNAMWCNFAFLLNEISRRNNCLNFLLALENSIYVVPFVTVVVAVGIWMMVTFLWLFVLIREWESH